MLTSIVRFVRGGKKLSRMATLLALAVVTAVAAGLAAQEVAPPGMTPNAAETERKIDLEADRLLKQMCDYMGSLQAFTVHARNTNEVMLVNGQKLDFESTSLVTVKRPNMVRSNRVGVVDEASFYYDGKSLTLRVKDGERDFYGTQPMPSSLDETLDTLRSQMELEIPGADLLYSDAYEGMTWEVTEARYIGIESLGDVRAHHLAFRTPSIDFQVWVADGDRPLPCKYVITTKWTTGAPQFGVELTDWNLAPEIDDEFFTFVPPPGAMKIDFLEMKSR